MGADVLIDYEKEDYIEAVLRATDGRGVDVVFDTIGGNALSRSPDALAQLGRVVSIVDIAQPQNLIQAWGKNAAYHFVFTRQNRGKLDELNALVAQGPAAAACGRGLWLADVPAAHARLESRNNGVRGRSRLRWRPPGERALAASDGARFRGRETATGSAVGAGLAGYVPAIRNSSALDKLKPSVRPEVPLREYGGRDVPDIAEPRLPRHRHDLGRRIEADERCPAGAGALDGHFDAGRTSGAICPTGSMNVMASVEPGASAATCRNVASVASRVRYMLTPVDATNAGRVASKPASASACQAEAPASKSTGTSCSHSGTP